MYFLFETLITGYYSYSTRQVINYNRKAQHSNVRKIHSTCIHCTGFKIWIQGRHGSKKKLKLKRFQLQFDSLTTNWTLNPSCLLSLQSTRQTRFKQPVTSRSLTTLPMDTLTPEYHCNCNIYISTVQVTWSLKPVPVTEEQYDKSTLELC